MITLQEGGNAVGDFVAMNKKQLNYLSIKHDLHVQIIDRFSYQRILLSLGEVHIHRKIRRRGIILVELQHAKVF